LRAKLRGVLKLNRFLIMAATVVVMLTITFNVTRIDDSSTVRGRPKLIEASVFHLCIYIGRSNRKNKKVLKKASNIDTESFI